MEARVVENAGKCQVLTAGPEPSHTESFWTAGPEKSYIRRRIWPLKPARRPKKCHLGEGYCHFHPLKSAIFG
jgi:hypothetical protein